VYDELIARCRKSLAASGVNTHRIIVARAADMRYVGQEHPVTVELPASIFTKRDLGQLKARFDEEHLRRYGTCAPDERAEIVSLRASVSGVMDKPPLERLPRGGSAPLASARQGRRKVYFAEAGKTLLT